MSDDFERKLAVALKTATRDLPPAADVLVTPTVAPRRSRSRLTLAAAVVVALAVAVGGGWWALTGDDHRSTPVVAASPDVAQGVCTASDVTVAPADVGGGGFTTGIVVAAQRSCELSTPPTVTLTAGEPGAGPRTVPYAASATDRSDRSPWPSTQLEAGGSLAFSLTAEFGDASCPSSGAPVTVAAGVSGPPLASFDWFVGCGGVTGNFVVTPATTDPDPSACTAADVGVQSSTTASAATLELTARGGRSCTLVDPPTVLLDSTLAPSWPSVDLHAAGVWLPRTLSPDGPVTFDVSLTDTAADCAAVTVDHLVHVAVAGRPITDVPWTSRSCVGVPVTVPR